LRSLVAVVVLLAPPHDASAQDGPIHRPPERRDIAYFEFAGPGGFFSLNYERRITPQRIVRAGFTSWDISNLDGVKHKASALLGGAMHLIDVSETPGFGGGAGKFVELGGVLAAGSYTRQRYGVTEGDGAFVAVSPTAGLRYDPPGGDFLYRVTFTPIIGVGGGAGTALDGKSGLSGGISAGYVF